MNDPDARYLVQVDGNTSTGCEYCDYRIDAERFPDGANHYIQEHGMRVIGAGQQTSRDYDGHPYHFPFVLLGGAELPRERDPISFRIEVMTPK